MGLQFGSSAVFGKQEQAYILAIIILHSPMARCGDG